MTSEAFCDLGKMFHFLAVTELISAIYFMPPLPSNHSFENAVK
jgi:hypothetical protein